MAKSKGKMKSKEAKQDGTSDSVQDIEISAEPEVAIEEAAEVSIEEQMKDAGEDDVNAEKVEDVNAEKVEDDVNAEETDKSGEFQVAGANETPNQKKQHRKFKKDKTSTVPASSHKEKKQIELAGVIFMCNTATKKDCFKYRVFGFPEHRKDVVQQLKKGMKLFLFDIDRKLMYGIYTASSQGGIDLVPEAFKDSDRKYPAQVRFRIDKDCMPLEENEFKHAIKENYYSGSKFKSELSYEQVNKLVRLFRPLDSKGLPKPKNVSSARRESDFRANAHPASSRGPRIGASVFPRGGGAGRARRVAPSIREPLYLYGRDTALYPQSGYVSASQAALAEAEAVYRQRLLEAQSESMRRAYALDPTYRSLDYQREIPYGGLRSGLPY